MLTEVTYAPNKFQHASALCSLRGSMLTAFYSGDMECHDSQRVILSYDYHSPDVELEQFTGNPVLFNTHDDICNIIYSKFEEFPSSRVKWWQHCTLWTRIIEYDSGSRKLLLSKPKQLIVKENGVAKETGYLPRCNPITVKRENNQLDLYLPLYHEQHPNYYGVCLKSRDYGLSWETLGNIKDDKSPCIQPTFWHKDGYLHAYLRNFKYRGLSTPFAYYSKSKDGSDWSKPTLSTTVLNANNSLVAVNKDMLVWNEDTQGRANLVLGTIDGHVITVIDKYGHYPSAYINNGLLHIAYTTNSNHYVTPHASKVIKRKVYDFDALNKKINYLNKIIPR